MGQLKRKQIFMEDEIPQNMQQQEQPTEDTIVDDLLAQLNAGEITLEDINNMYQNGELAEEDYQAIIQAIDEQNAQEIVTKINNGEITPEDVDKMLANQEISQNAYQMAEEELAAQEEGQDQQVAPEEEMPQEEPQPIVGKYNLVRLFEKYVALKKYIDIYIKSYKYIEKDELTNMQITALAKFYNEIIDLRDNLNFYMENTYDSEDYKKNLYSYLLFNKDFATQIKKFRHILHLNPNKIIEEKNEKKKR